MSPVRRASTLLTAMLLVGCPQTKDKAVTPEQKEAAARQHLLEDLVAAPDRQTFSQRLRTYGPIEAQDVPYLTSQARSWRESLRHNAARLLSIARSPDALSALRKLASETQPDARAVPELTDRETEVLRLVAMGLSSKEIADQLSISHRTVQNHVQNTLGKLQLHNRVELTRFALERGLQ